MPGQIFPSLMKASGGMVLQTREWVLRGLLCGFKTKESRQFKIFWTKSIQSVPKWPDLAQLYGLVYLGSQEWAAQLHG